jgi:protoheme IX farnesyltransferase
MNRIKDLDSIDDDDLAAVAMTTTAQAAAERGAAAENRRQRSSIFPETRLIDFYELIKPRMNLLVVATTLVGYYMAASSKADWLRLPHALIGTALCAASAAILNQLAERRFDAMMPRTAKRPLPTGRVSTKEAMTIGICAGVVGGAYLLYFVNALTAILGVGTVLSYVLIYTPLKRRTVYNTIVGAIPGAIPPVMGFAAVKGSFTPSALALFSILFVWQIPHFMAIATLYKEDYRLGGFKMLPVNDRGLLATSRHIVLFSAALIPISLAPTIIHMTGYFYFLWASVLGIFFLKYALAAATDRRREDARRLFFFSIIYLPALLALMMFDRQ